MRFFRTLILVVVGFLLTLLLFHAARGAEAAEPTCPDYTVVEKLAVDQGVKVRCSPFSNASVFVPDEAYVLRDISSNFGNLTQIDRTISELKDAEPPALDLTIRTVLADFTPIEDWLSNDRTVAIENIEIIVNTSAPGTTISYNRDKGSIRVDKVRIEVPSEELRKAWEQVFDAKKEKMKVVFTAARDSWLETLERFRQSQLEISQKQAALIKEMETGTHVVIPE